MILASVRLLAPKTQNPESKLQSQVIPKAIDHFTPAGPLLLRRLSHRQPRSDGRDFAGLGPEPWAGGPGDWDFVEDLRHKPAK